MRAIPAIYIKLREINKSTLIFIFSKVRVVDIILVVSRESSEERSHFVLSGNDFWRLSA